MLKLFFLIFVNVVSSKVNVWTKDKLPVNDLIVGYMSMNTTMENQPTHFAGCELPKPHPYFKVLRCRATVEEYRCVYLHIDPMTGMLYEVVIASDTCGYSNWEQLTRRPADMENILAREKILAQEDNPDQEKKE
jgi:hypothetical protein